MSTPPPSAATSTPKSSLPPNYVTLKQLQELRLKEKQEEEERRLCELKEAREKKAPKQRPPEAAEVTSNPARRRQLPPAVPERRPSPNPQAEKLRNPVRSQTVEAAAGDENTDGKPLERRGHKKKYNKKKKKKGKPVAEKETNTVTGSEQIAAAPPLTIPIVPKKNLPEEKHREVTNRGGAEIRRRVAETGVDCGAAGAETRKRTDSGRRMDGERNHGGRSRRYGRDGSSLVWVRKAKPSEHVPAGA